MTEIIEVKLPCGNKTLISKEDEYLIKLFPHWRLQRKTYVIITRYIKTEYGRVRQDIYLARAIVKPPKHLIVDHIDRNPLNNTRSNLRLGTQQENMWNISKIKNKTSKYYGVSICRSAKSNKWRVFFRKPDGSRITGCFSTELEAAKRFDELSKLYRGSFGVLNFPNE